MRRFYWPKIGTLFVVALYSTTQVVWAHLPQLSFQTRRPAHNAIRLPPLTDKTLFHIQDVHMNIEAQKSMASMLQTLVESHSVDVVGLEGAVGKLDYSLFRDPTQWDTRRRVGQDFMNQGKMDAASYWALTSPSSLPVVIGADHKPTYRLNVQAVQEAQPHRDSVQNQVDKQIQELNQVKKDVFSPALLELDRVVERYRKGELPLTPYLKKLSEIHPVPSMVIEQFVSAADCEEKMNWAQLTRERTNLIQTLASRLRPADLKTLNELSLAFKQQKLSHKNFWSSLQGLCQAYQISLHSYPELRNYIQYIQLADAIDAKKLFSETRTLEKDAYNLLIQSDEEKQITEQGRWLYLVSKLIQFSLTAEEWHEYKNLDQKNYSSPSFLPFENFYHHAETRNHFLVRHLLNELEKQNGRIGVLIAGGFHAQGIQALTEQKGWSYISLTPRLTQVNTKTGTQYLSLFHREKSPLEKIFRGPKLFLSPGLALPNDPSADMSFIGDRRQEIAQSLGLSLQTRWMRKLLERRDIDPDSYEGLAEETPWWETLWYLVPGLGVAAILMAGVVYGLWDGTLVQNGMGAFVLLWSGVKFGSDHDGSFRLKAIKAGVGALLGVLSFWPLLLGPVHMTSLMAILNSYDTFSPFLFIVVAYFIHRINNTLVFRRKLDPTFLTLHGHFPLLRENFRRVASDLDQSLAYLKKNLLQKQTWTLQDLKEATVLLNRHNTQIPPDLTKEIMEHLMRVKSDELEGHAHANLDSRVRPHQYPYNINATLKLGYTILCIEVARYEAGDTAADNNDENKILWRVNAPAAMDPLGVSFFALVSDGGRLILMNGASHYSPSAILFAHLQNRFIQSRNKETAALVEENQFQPLGQKAVSLGEFKALWQVIHKTKIPFVYGTGLASPTVFDELLKGSDATVYGEDFLGVFLELFQGYNSPQLTFPEGRPDLRTELSFFMALHTLAALSKQDLKDVISIVVPLLKEFCEDHTQRIERDDSAATKMETYHKFDKLPANLERISNEQEFERARNLLKENSDRPFLVWVTGAVHTNQPLPHTNFEVNISWLDWGLDSLVSSNRLDPDFWENRDLEKDYANLIDVFVPLLSSDELMFLHKRNEVVLPRVYPKTGPSIVRDIETHWKKSYSLALQSYWSEKRVTQSGKSRTGYEGQVVLISRFENRRRLMLGGGLALATFFIPNPTFISLLTLLVILVWSLVLLAGDQNPTIRVNLFFQRLPLALMLGGLAFFPFLFFPLHDPSSPGVFIKLIFYLALSLGAVHLFHLSLLMMAYSRAQVGRFPSTNPPQALQTRRMRESLERRAIDPDSYEGLVEETPWWETLWYLVSGLGVAATLIAGVLHGLWGGTLVQIGMGAFVLLWSGVKFGSDHDGSFRLKAIKAGVGALLGGLSFWPLLLGAVDMSSLLAILNSYYTSSMFLFIVVAYFIHRINNYIVFRRRLDPTFLTLHGHFPLLRENFRRVASDLDRSLAYLKKNLLQKKTWTLQDLKEATVLLNRHNTLIPPDLTKEIMEHLMAVKSSEINGFARSTKNHTVSSSEIPFNIKAIQALGTAALTIEINRYEKGETSAQDSDDNKAIWRVDPPEEIDRAHANFFALVSDRGRLILMNGAAHQSTPTIFFASLQSQFMEKRKNETVALVEETDLEPFGYKLAQIAEFGILMPTIRKNKIPLVRGPNLLSPYVFKKFLERNSPEEQEKALLYAFVHLFKSSSLPPYLDQTQKPIPRVELTFVTALQLLAGLTDQNPTELGRRLVPALKKFCDDHAEKDQKKTYDQKRETIQYLESLKSALLKESNKQEFEQARQLLQNNPSRPFLVWYTGGNHTDQPSQFDFMMGSPWLEANIKNLSTSDLLDPDRWESLDIETTYEGLIHQFAPDFSSNLLLTHLDLGASLLPILYPESGPRLAQRIRQIWKQHHPMPLFSQWNRVQVTRFGKDPGSYYGQVKLSSRFEHRRRVLLGMALVLMTLFVQNRLLVSLAALTVVLFWSAYLLAWDQDPYLKVNLFWQRLPRSLMLGILAFLPLLAGPFVFPIDISSQWAFFTSVGLPLLMALSVAHVVHKRFLTQHFKRGLFSSIRSLEIFSTRFIDLGLTFDDARKIRDLIRVVGHDIPVEIAQKLMDRLDKLIEKSQTDPSWALHDIVPLRTFQSLKAEAQKRLSPPTPQNPDALQTGWMQRFLASWGIHPLSFFGLVVATPLVEGAFYWGLGLFVDVSTTAPWVSVFLWVYILLWSAGKFGWDHDGPWATRFWKGGVGFLMAVWVFHPVLFPGVGLSSLGESALWGHLFHMAINFQVYVINKNISQVPPTFDLNQITSTPVEDSSPDSWPDPWTPEPRLLPHWDSKKHIEKSS